VPSRRANAKSNPGKLSFGSGPGSINYMVVELYKIEAGVNIVFVPYRGRRHDTVSHLIRR
jgi:hypothetical protein